MHNLRKTGWRLFARIEAGFAAAFTPAWNPLYHLGALSIFFFWVVLVTGIYLFVFFDTSVHGAYASVERLTHAQWYFGGVLRSLHRYASDAAVITITVHIVKEFLMGRHRGARWFSWFTGVPLLWLVFPLGITGYWLVWDQLAQYVAIASAELLDALPIFSNPMARNFLTDANLSDRFFTFMAFLHLLGLPVFLLFGVWFHVLRIARPKVNPPLGLAIGTLAALTLAAFVHPALSQGPTDLAQAPTGVGLDWFYLPAYPLLDIVSAGSVWAILVGSSLVLSAAPWLPPRQRAAPARVALASCNGCGWCVADCPYSAVTLAPRSDGLAYETEAVVDPDLCTSCGICAGACPTATPMRQQSKLVPGIELPQLRTSELYAQTLAAAKPLTGNARVLVYGCATGAPNGVARPTDVGYVALECVGMLPPSFIDMVISRRHADGVFLLGCREHDCNYRFGVAWTEERLDRARDPMLRERVPRERVHRYWAGFVPVATLNREIDAFQHRLRALGPFERRTGSRAPAEPIRATGGT